MFHLVQKPLTTPSFLSVDVLCCLFFLRSLPPSFPRFCLSVFVCISFPFCVPSFWGMSSCCFSFYMLETLSVCLSVSLSSFYFLACHPQQVPDAFFTNSTCFSRMFLKGFFFTRRRMEMRSDMLADLHSPLICK